MCGIAGFSLCHEDRCDALALSRHLLRAIESRGRDASGAVWTEDGAAYLHKEGLPASQYVRHLPMAPTATTAALHTRYATKGDPRVNANNHPFSLPGVTGVHNGVIRNDDEVFARLGVDRTCDTDSEAIFALLAYDEGDPLDALATLDGDAAIAWVETERPNNLHLARLSGRPLAVGETVAGSFLFASTLPLLRRAAFAARTPLGDTWEVPEWTYLRVWRGIVREVRRFGPAAGRPGRPVRRPVDLLDRWDAAAGFDDDGRDARDFVPSALRLGEW